MEHSRFKLLTAVGVMIICLVLFPLLIRPAGAYAKDRVTGESLFKKNCAGCHISADRVPRHKHIVKIMRNPPSYMPVFTKERISDSDAKKIEDYILLVFKKTKPLP